MHCAGHQRESTEAARGNNLADKAAKEAAKGGLIMPLIPVLDLSQFDSEYSTADLEKAKGLRFGEEVADSGWKRIRKELYCFLNI